MCLCPCSSSENGNGADGKELTLPRHAWERVRSDTISVPWVPEALVRVRMWTRERREKSDIGKATLEGACRQSHHSASTTAGRRL